VGNRPEGNTISTLFNLESLLCLVLVLLQSLSTAAWSQINVTNISLRQRTHRSEYAGDRPHTGERKLNSVRANSSQFLWMVHIAQPLYLAGVQNIAGGTHNVLYIATQHASLFAIDADTGAILWQKSFINPAAA